MIGTLVALLVAQSAGQQARLVAPGALPRTEVQARITARFAILDANHDEGVDLAEARAAADAAAIEVRNSGVQVMSDIPGSGLDTNWFAPSDANHDGRVTLAELSAAPLANFDRLDLNHDGVLSTDERRRDPQLPVMRPAN